MGMVEEEEIKRAENMCREGFRDGEDMVLLSCVTYRTFQAQSRLSNVSENSTV
jgi:sialic acid synthase SpsE